MIRIEITPVLQYRNNLPIYVDTPIVLGDLDIINISGGLSYNIDYYQEEAVIVKIGELTLTLNNTSGDFTPGHTHFVGGDRDHRVAVFLEKEGGADEILWQGFVKQVTLGNDAVVTVRAEHEFNRFDDLLIDGDENFDPDADDDTNNARPQVPFSEIIDELDRKLPGYLTPIIRDLNTYTTTSTFQDTAAPMPDLMVYRPEEAARGRDYLNQVLLAARLALSLCPATGKLVIGSIDTIARQGGNNSHLPRPALVIGTRDVLSVRQYDIKERMYNVIHASYFNSEDDLVIATRGSNTRPPNIYIGRYGQRELELTMEHLTEAQARAACIELQGHLMLARRHWAITLNNPPGGITARDMVKLEITHINQAPLLANGYGIVMGHRVNIADETIEIEVAELFDPSAGGTITIPTRSE